MSDNNACFSSENIDEYLKELAKEYRKINGKHIPAEIILVGGASILVNYGFRDTTYDIDAITNAASAMKDAANKVRDTHNLSNEWFNSDFKNTASYSPKLIQFSKHYRTYSNIVDVRTISGEYLMAMKLMAGRPYKHDLSDAAEIYAEHQKRGTPISYECVQKAINDLYGDSAKIPDTSTEFLQKIYQSQDITALIQEQKDYEKQAKTILLTFEKSYSNVLNEDNLSDILQELNKKTNTKTTEITPSNNKTSNLAHRFDTATSIAPAESNEIYKHDTTDYFTK